MPGTTDCCCAGAPLHQVLVVDADLALRGLLEEWMSECGCRLTYASLPGDGGLGHYDLVIVDVPFPRQGGLDLLRRVGNEHPRTPILALSSTFFGSVACAGAVARALGVASVLPKPVSREALVSAARNLLSRDPHPAPVPQAGEGATASLPAGVTRPSAQPSPPRGEDR